MASPYDREDDGLEQDAYPSTLEETPQTQGDEIDTDPTSSGGIDEFSQEAKRFQDRLDAGESPSSALYSDAESLRDLYKKNEKSSGTKRGIKGYFKSKVALGLTGSGITGVAAIIVALIMAISPLKFEFLFENIDASAYLRYNTLFDRRSSKFMDAYVKARLFEIRGGDPGESMLFRATRVDNNNPFIDWYRTMRTSSFEADLLSKHGISFAAITDPDPSGNGAIRGIKSAQITFNRQNVDVDIEGALESAGLNVDDIDNRIRNGDYTFMRNLDSNAQARLFDFDIFNTDRAGRLAIKSAVDKEIPKLRFLKRFFLRRNIQNMVGVRNWRFFEKTRDNFDNRKIRFQNKLLEKTFELTNSNGKFIGCLFGGKCVRSTDVTSPEMQANGTPTADGDKEDTFDDSDPDSSNDPSDEANARLNNDTERNNSSRATKEALQDTREALLQIDGEGDTITTKTLKKLVSSNLLKRLGVITAAISMVQLMDTMLTLHKNMIDGTLSRMISAMRLASYASVYTAFATLKDQINSGEVIDGEDTAAAYESLEGIEASEAYNVVMKKRGMTAEQKNAACQPGEEDRRIAAFDSGDIENMGVEPNCPEDQIGSGASGGEKLIQGYQDTVGKIVNPFFVAYEGLTNAPVFGQINEAILTGTSMLDSVTSFISDKALETLGLTDNVEQFTEWVGDQIASAFGLAPVIDGSYGPATANAILTGGVGLAESSLRWAGGRFPDENSQAYMKTMVAEFKSEQIKTMSIWDKYFAVDNSQSLVAKLALSTPTSFSELKNSFTNQPQFIASSVSNPVYAEEEATPTASEFAAMQEYDFSPENIESDPIMRTPEECSNVKNILGNSFDTSDFGLMSDATRFWNAVHSKAGEVFGEGNYDAEVGQIENICLADAEISRAMKTKYTDEDDGGLSSGAAASAGSTTPTNTPGELEYPPNLGGPNSEGYFAMPEPADGSYIFSSGAPPRSRCGSKALVGVIYTVAKRWKQEFPGSTIVVGDLNEEQGHVSHNYGTDVDITVTGTPDAANTASDPSGQYSIRLAQLFADTKQVKIIGYQDQRVINDYAAYAGGRGLPGSVAPWSGHADHFHVRILDQYKGPYSGQCA